MLIVYGPCCIEAYINSFHLADLASYHGTAVDVDERNEGKDAVGQAVLAYTLSVLARCVARHDPCD